MGAEVHGLSLDPPTQPNLFGLLGLSESMASDMRGDIGDADIVRKAMTHASPEIVFHLAAQPIVRESYDDPLRTYLTNVMGTAHVLDSARSAPSVRSIVVVTTDKCYENREWSFPYRESDPLGGHDPYSSSKACAELVAASYRSSFFSREGSALVATARAGNVIGGGDWAADRLIPDCVRAFLNQQPVRLRSPGAIRPWQHVLDPLAGYLLLAERLYSSGGRMFAESWNFGPDLQGDATVLEIASSTAKVWSGKVEIEAHEPAKHEAKTLRLDSTRSRTVLGWQPTWPLARALDETGRWYRAWSEGKDMREFSQQQLGDYISMAASVR